MNADGYLSYIPDEQLEDILEAQRSDLEVAWNAGYASAGDDYASSHLDFDRNETANPYRRLV